LYKGFSFPKVARMTKTPLPSVSAVSSQEDYHATQVLLNDPGRLIDSSRVRSVPRLLRPQTAFFLMLAAGFVFLLPVRWSTLLLLETLLWGGFVGIMLYLWLLVRDLKQESALLNRIEDGMMLKSYVFVAEQLQRLMSQPMRSDPSRLRAMILLASLLAKLGRYEESLNVYNELVDLQQIAGPSRAMVKLSRAMVMLQSDHLYDADRAIHELRRLIDRGGAEQELQRIDPYHASTSPEETFVGALRLVELYRDVKTGHAQEAIEIFENHLPVMVRGLGHRVGDAYALVAVAHDRLGQTDQAAKRFQDGTTLQGISDLLNRYVELRPLVTRYAPMPVPAL
jgi:tetratricopeptide (TPR) repeat protein